MEIGRITEQQLEELREAYDFDEQRFAEKLEEYTGIVRRSYIAHNYYDASDNYIGCSEEFDLDNLLENAYIEVAYES